MILRLIKVIASIFFYAGFIPVGLAALLKYIINGKGDDLLEKYEKLDPFYSTL